MEETNEGDVLMLPEEVSSLNVDGYVAHPFFALVVLIEYTIRYKLDKDSASRMDLATSFRCKLNEGSASSMDLANFF